MTVFQDFKAFTELINALFVQHLALYSTINSFTVCQYNTNGRWFVSYTTDSITATWLKLCNSLDLPWYEAIK